VSKNLYTDPSPSDRVSGRQVPDTHTQIAIPTYEFIWATKEGSRHLLVGAIRDNSNGVFFLMTWPLSL
jgi:hypothetical protein